jgi:undecaprenyl-diphosphatase
LQLPRLVQEAGGPGRLLAENSEVRLMAMIFVGSIPTAILGMLFATAAEHLFSNAGLVGITLIITGTVLWFTHKFSRPGYTIGQMPWYHGLLIGLAQGLAITPGISRSGATIATALYLGMDRRTAFRFSFLLSIPAISGAFLLGLDGKALAGSLPVGMMLAGGLSAALVGYIALKILSRLVIGGWLYRFAPYCWIVGAIALLASSF